VKRLVRFDECKDAVLSLHLLRELLPKVRDEERYWKWVMISLHSGLQGFMVLLLQGSDKLEIMSDNKSTKSFIHYYRGLAGLHGDKINNLPSPHLKKFRELYQSIKNEDLMIPSDQRRPLPLEERHDTSVMDLDAIRNGFVHFFPRFSSSDALGFIEVTRDCLEVISFLVSTLPKNVWCPPQLEMESINLIAEVREGLETISESVEGVAENHKLGSSTKINWTNQC